METRPSEAPPDAPARGWRGTPDLWLDAAQALLAEGGVEAVKVMPLAARLGLSRTSFYWHFADREAMLAGLLTRWEGRTTAPLAARCALGAPSVTAAILNVFDCWLWPDLFDAALDAAVRSWGRTEAQVAARVAEADAARIAALTGLFLRHGYAPAEADTRARTVYLTQLGYFALNAPDPYEERMRRIPAYALTFTGQVPTEAEIAAFTARHPPPAG